MRNKETEEVMQRFPMNSAIRVSDTLTDASWGKYGTVVGYAYNMLGECVLIVQPILENCHIVQHPLPIHFIHPSDVEKF